MTAVNLKIYWMGQMKIQLPSHHNDLHISMNKIFDCIKKYGNPLLCTSEYAKNIFILVVRVISFKPEIYVVDI